MNIATISAREKEICIQYSSYRTNVLVFLYKSFLINY